MSQSNASASKKSGCPIGCIILGFVLIVFIAGAIGVLFWFLSQNAPTPVDVWVSISSPTDGSSAELNVPLSVQATAQHPSGITRVEVYADGGLALVQNTTLPAGDNPFVLSQRWAPLTMGRHILTARAYNREGKFGDSSIVNVDVVAVRNPTAQISVDAIPGGQGARLPTLNEIASGLHITVPRLIDLNPGLQGRDPNTPIPSGTDLNVPRLPVPPPDTSSGSDSSGGTSGGSLSPLPDAPTAPTNLAADVDCVSIRLRWNDSPNEEHYVIYRHVPGESGFTPLPMTLPMNSTSYRDTISRLGEYHYRVAAVRGGLEGSIQLTVRTPDSCAPDIGTPPRIPDLILTFMTIDTVTRYPGIYCYVTIDGRAEHVPQGDFRRLQHDADGLRYDLRLLENHGEYVLPHLDTEPLTLSGECYGDASIGGASGVAREDWLGSFSATHPSTDWDGRVREFGTTSDRTFRLRYRIGRRPTPTDIRSGGLRDAEVVLPPRVEDPLMPVPTRVRFESAMRSICIIPGTCPRYVNWNWVGNDFYTEDTLTGYRVVLNLTDLTVPRQPTRELRRWEVSGGRDKSAPLPALPPDVVCGARYSVAVLAYQLEPRTGVVRESRWSGPLQWTMPDCPREADVHVTVDKVVFGPSRGAAEIKDDEHCAFPSCTDRRIEVSGYVQVYGLNVMAGANVPAVPYALGRCPSGLFCTEGGEYGTVSTTHTPWDIDMTNMVRPEANISVIVALDDNDVLGGPAPLCRGNVTFPRRSAVEWLRTNETREISNDFGEASCRIVIRVRGQPPR